MSLVVCQAVSHGGDGGAYPGDSGSDCSEPGAGGPHGDLLGLTVDGSREAMGPLHTRCQGA